MFWMNFILLRNKSSEQKLCESYLQSARILLITKSKPNEEAHSSMMGKWIATVQWFYSKAPNIHSPVCCLYPLICLFLLRRIHWHKSQSKQCKGLDWKPGIWNNKMPLTSFSTTAIIISTSTKNWPPFFQMCCQLTFIVWKVSVC